MGVEKVDMSGKLCVVTGANSGIGKATALGLAQMGATVVMVCRNAVRGEEALQEIRAKTRSESLELMMADMASQVSIRQFAENFKQKHQQLHVLVNNAALILGKRAETADGIEMQFGVNHLAVFLLTHLLLDVLKASAPARIVNVASTSHQNATIDFDDLHGRRKYGAMRVYGQSKLANVLFTYELAKRLEGTGVTANCLHPGVVNTEIARNFPAPIRILGKLFGFLMLSAKKGAETSLHLATSPDVEGVTGEYFVKKTRALSSRESHDRAVAKRLWEISAELTGCEV